MNSPQAIYALRWLVRDTLCQALASRILWIMLGVSALCIVFCLGISVEGADNLRPEGDYLYHPKTDQPLTGPTGDLGSMHLFFGALQVGLPRDRASGVHLIHVVLGTWVAGAIGLLATLVWTAGFIPESLQPTNAALLLAKPVPRCLFLLGKYFGVVLFVAFQASVFFVGTWLALGLRTNVWLYGYLAGIPLLVLQFSVIFSVSVLIASATRSTMACVVGSILFWGLCLCVNYARYTALALPQLSPQTPPLSSFTAFFLEASYWILPKPLDFLLILEQALNTRAHMATLSTLPEFATAMERGAFEPIGSVLSSCLFAVVLLVFAGRRLRATDY